MARGVTLFACPAVDGEGFLEVDASFQTVVPAARRLADLAEVWRTEGTVAGEAVAYRMYRGLCRPQDQQVFDRHGVRHDVTVIRPGTVAGEYIKTYGHHHPAPFPGGPSYPEVYEVLAGQGLFLLQRASRSGELRDVCVIEGRPGQKIVIPPDYGHVTINSGDEWLVVANLVAYGWDSTYALYRARRGAAYYALQGDAGPVFLPNLRYGTVPPLRQAEPGGLERFGVRDDVPLYDAFLLDPRSFAFLTHPEAYADVFDRGEWC